MNILFLTHYYLPEGNAAASRVSALATRWVKQGHKVTIVTCVPNAPKGKIYEGYKNKYTKENIDGVEVVRIKTYIAANKGTVKRILNYISYMVSAVWNCLFMKKPDVMIATSPHFFCGWAGVLLHWIRRFPFILEIRDIWPESIQAVGAKIPKPIIFVLEIMEKIMYKSAKHIVTVGDGYKSRLIEKNVAENKISVIMNGVDSTNFYPKEKNNSLLEEFSIKNKFVISYIGTIGMACGLKVVINAAKILKEKKLDDISFMLVGDGAIKDELEQEVKNTKLDNIIFTGLRPKKEIVDWINLSDVSLVHLKKTDLFKTVMPSKIFESAACKIPILIGVDGFARQFVETANAGIYFEPENVDGLVNAIVKFYNDKKLIKELGENAFNNIALKYNRDNQAAKYLEVMNSVISK
ncbi:MAG: glycosyltransferase family 4 protein [Elusimicrobia bacterium]|nr:glycosyltransferase family 4 protein [Elusimicrobiota bacterium]